MTKRWRAWRTHRLAAPAVRRDVGPRSLAPIPEPDDPIRLTEPAAPAPDGWLRPGTMLGLPIVWVAICLGIIPIAVYVVSYVPWAASATSSSAPARRTPPAARRCSS